MSEVTSRNIIFNSINVNAQKTNSGVFIGDSSAYGWDSNNKNQFSAGMIFNAFGGYNFFPGNLFLLSDNDLIDTVISDSDYESGSIGQS